jgi:hypothetical protein
MDNFYERNGYYSVFTGPGVIERKSFDSESDYKLGILGVYRNEDISKGPDDLLVVFDNYQGKEFPVDLEQTTVDPDTGIISFSAVGGDYTIRKVVEEDNSWISQDGESRSVEELEALITGEGSN